MKNIFSKIKTEMCHHLSEVAIDRLQNCADMADKETGHIKADDILCDLLENLGFIEVVRKYRELEKWYA